MESPIQTHPTCDARRAQVYALADQHANEICPGSSLDERCPLEYLAVGVALIVEDMMLTGVHFLLTYTCNNECDHCFLYCNPSAQGTFTRSRLDQALREAAAIPSVEWAYFEGGEPFLFYPLMLQGIRTARDLGLKTGVVTNCYWATSLENALLWLEPLQELGVNDLSLSDDAFHHGENEDNPAKIALAAARSLGLPAATICIAPPENAGPDSVAKGEPVTGGSVMYRGRAVEKLAAGLPRTPWEKLKECPHEDLQDPQRVHVDPFGNVQLCQGLCMGNMWQTPLSVLIETYEPLQHPICGPLIRGGPAELAKHHGVNHEVGYVDECHLCWEVRKSLIDRFPQYLAPRQVYGVE